MGPVKQCRTRSYSHKSKYISILRLRVIAIVQVSEIRDPYIFAKCLPAGSFLRPFVVHRLFYTRVSNNFDPHQARRFVGSDLDPNCLLHVNLSADATGTCR